MTWLFGYHFKWRICKKIAAAKGLKVASPEFLTTAVENEIRRDSRGVKFWISFDWAHRPIITFFENKTECDPTGIKFTVNEVGRVAKAMGLRRNPRWYTTQLDEADLESESSEDDEIEMGNIPENPWLSQSAPTDMWDSESSDEDCEVSETMEPKDQGKEEEVEGLRGDTWKLKI